MTKTLPQGFTIRPATMDDLQSVLALVTARKMAGKEARVFTENNLRQSWLAPDFNLATDAWVVTAPSGRCVGHAYLLRGDHAHLTASIQVDLAYYGQGVRACLLQSVESQAMQEFTEAPPDARITLHTWILEPSTADREFFEYAGYALKRSSWRMEITMQKPPPVPQWPADVTVRTFQPGLDERVVYETINEAFRDLWNSTPMTFEEWAHWTINDAHFDPTLWFLAYSGDAIAGAACCKYLADKGWVDDLGVLRPWRKRGIGLALLYHAFGEFYRRGDRCVGLSVDAQNPSGAARLYKHAGMHVAHSHLYYEKELRPGEEPGVQSNSG